MNVRTDVIRQAADGSNGKMEILRGGRYPIDIVTSLLNNRCTNPDHIFDNIMLGTEILRLEKGKRLPPSAVKRHKFGSARLNSLDEEGVFALLDHYNSIRRIGPYTQKEVRDYLARKKEEYLTGTAYGRL